MVNEKIVATQYDYKQYDNEAQLLKDALTFLSTLKQTKVIRINDSCHRGYADLLLCYHGQFVAIELKDKIGKPSPHQLLFLDNIIKAQGIGGIAHNLSEIKTILSIALYRAKKVFN